MNAYIVMLYWRDSKDVASNIVMFGTSSEEVHYSAWLLFPDHAVICVEPAPWLDKPILEGK